LNSPFAPKSRLGTTYGIPEFSPNGPWAIVAGRCIFPVGVSRTINGAQVELGTASNPETTPKILPGRVVGEYETQGFKWNMTSEIRELGRPEVLGIFLPAVVARNVQWAVNAFSAQITGPPTVIPPCTDMTVKFTPWIAFVTLVPLFQVDGYWMDISGRMNRWIDDTQVRGYNSWRNWGADWMGVYANALQINGMAEILTHGGPDGLERTVRGVINYDYERQPRCP
jgi:hypothetical protein